MDQITFPAHIIYDFLFHHSYICIRFIRGGNICLCSICTSLTLEVRDLQLFIFNGCSLHKVFKSRITPELVNQMVEIWREHIKLKLGVSVRPLKTLSALNVLQENYFKLPFILQSYIRTVKRIYHSEEKDGNARPDPLTIVAPVFSAHIGCQVYDGLLDL